MSLTTPSIIELERAGLRDTYMVASHETEVYSLDPQRKLDRRPGSTAKCPPTLREAMKRLPESQQLKVLDGYQKGVSCFIASAG